MSRMPTAVPFEIQNAILLESIPLSASESHNKSRRYEFLARTRPVESMTIP